MYGRLPDGPWVEIEPCCELERVPLSLCSCTTVTVEGVTLDISGFAVPGTEPGSEMHGWLDAEGNEHVETLR